MSARFQPLLNRIYSIVGVKSYLCRKEIDWKGTRLSDDLADVPLLEYVASYRSQGLCKAG